MRKSLTKRVGGFGLFIRENDSAASWLILVNPTESLLDFDSPSFQLTQATLLFGAKDEKKYHIGPMEIQAWKLSA